MLGRNDRRMLDVGDGDRRIDTLGQSLGRRGRRQLARFLADDLVVGRSAGQRLGARRGELRDGRRAAGFGLGDVGAGAFADLEARAGGSHLLFQELEVLRPKRGDLAVADDVHERARRIEQGVLFGIAQAFDGRPHPRLGGQRVVLGLKPVEQRLLDLDAEEPCGEAGAVLAAPGVVGAVLAGDGRPHSRLGDRHVFVGDAHAGARRIQRRIVGVGLGQRAGERFRRSRRQRKRGKRKWQQQCCYAVSTTRDPSSVDADPATSASPEEMTA